MVGNRNSLDLCRGMPPLQDHAAVGQEQWGAPAVELCHAGRPERIDCEHAGDDETNLRCFSICGQIGTERKANTEQTQQDGPAKHNPVRTALVNDGLALAELHRVTSYRRVYEVQGS